MTLSQEEMRQAALQLRDKFVDVCVRMTPPDSEERREREAHAPAEFNLLARHRTVEAVFVKDTCLFARTPLVCVRGRELGVYAIGVSPMQRDYKIVNMTRTVPEITTYGQKREYQHPHIGEQCKFCMPGSDENEIKDMMALGLLQRVMCLLADLLYQVYDERVYPPARLTQWPLVKQEQ